MTERSYLFALVDGGGTVPPDLGTVRRLIERGHRVTVLAEDSMLNEVRATGATFRPWVEAPYQPDRSPEHDPYRDWECKTPMQLFDRLLEKQFVGPAPAYTADLLAAVADDRPDVVVTSLFCFGAMIGAQAAGLPFAVSVTNPYPLPAPGMPPFGLGLKPMPGVLGRMRDRVLNGYTGRQFNKGPTAVERPAGAVVPLGRITTG
jgi:UDP:flavonoid glycosyltransferase YjiC (YdhE family)